MSAKMSAAPTSSRVQSERQGHNAGTDLTGSQTGVSGVSIDDFRREISITNSPKHPEELVQFTSHVAELRRAMRQVRPGETRSFQESREGLEQAIADFNALRREG